MQHEYILNDGNRIPCIGYGTWKLAENVVETALKAGYRLIDTASLYGSEEAVGEGVRKSGIKRDEIFISTKLWTDEMGYEEAKQALQRSLKRMQMDYVDLYLIHWPRMTASPEENWKERDLETWRAMEDMKKEGLVKSIGVSNFLPHHLENLIRNSSTVPAVDQLEMHAGYYQEYTLQYLKEHNILPMAWGPLGRGKAEYTPVLSVLQKVADRYGKSVQQIALRYLLQRGALPLPKANSEAHMRENLDVFGFEITQEDMSVISCIPMGTWLGEHPDLAIPQKKSQDQ